jgi:hypothetical protein
MPDLRLGDVIDDFCVKCRRLTNHSIVSILNSAAAKVRCRTCYSDHDYRNEQAPPSKKELARQKELYNAVLAGTAMPLDAAPSAQVAAAAQADPEIAPGVVEPQEDGDVRPAAKKAAKANRKK